MKKLDKYYKKSLRTRLRTDQSDLLISVLLFSIVTTLKSWNKFHTTSLASAQIILPILAKTNYDFFCNQRSKGRGISILFWG